MSFPEGDPPEVPLEQREEIRGASAPVGSRNDIGAPSLSFSEVPPGDPVLDGAATAGANRREGLPPHRVREMAIELGPQPASSRRPSLLRAALAACVRAIVLAARLVRRGWPVLRYLIGLAIAALVIWVLSGHTDELTGIDGIFSHLRWPWLIPALVVETGSLGAFALLQHRLLRAGGLEVPEQTLFTITWAAQAVTNSLPAGSAVAALYGFRWFRRLGASDSLAIWALIGTLVGSAISLALVATAGLSLAEGEGASLGLIPVIVGVLGVTVGAGALYLYRRPQQAVVRWWLGLWDRLSRRSNGDVGTRSSAIVARATAYRLHWRDVVVGLGWGIATWLLDCACFVIAFVAVGAAIPWKALMLAYGAGQLAANLPVTPGGLGAVEGSITIALVAFGGARAGTVDAVLIYRLISFWWVLAAGWVCAGLLALGVRRGRWPRSVLEGDPAAAALVSVVLHHQNPDVSDQRVDP